MAAAGILCHAMPPKWLTDFLAVVSIKRERKLQKRKRKDIGNDVSGTADDFVCRLQIELDQTD